MGPIGTAALGIGTGLAEGAAEQIFGEMNQKREQRGQKKALEQQNAAAMDTWEKTNYKAQMGQLEKAGLNAGLIYDMVVQVEHLEEEMQQQKELHLKLVWE